MVKVSVLHEWRIMFSRFFYKWCCCVCGVAWAWSLLLTLTTLHFNYSNRMMLFKVVDLMPSTVTHNKHCLPWRECNKSQRGWKFNATTIFRAKFKQQTNWNKHKQRVRQERQRNEQRNRCRCVKQWENSIFVGVNVKGDTRVNMLLFSCERHETLTTNQIRVFS